MHVCRQTARERLQMDYKGIRGFASVSHGGMRWVGKKGKAS